MFELVALCCTASCSCIMSHSSLQPMINQEIARQLCMEHQLLFSKAVIRLALQDSNYAFTTMLQRSVDLDSWYALSVGIIWWQLPIYGSHTKVSKLLLVKKGKIILCSKAFIIFVLQGMWISTQNSNFCFGWVWPLCSGKGLLVFLLWSFFKSL